MVYDQFFPGSTWASHASISECVHRKSKSTGQNLADGFYLLQRYEEAAQHILNALALQDADGVRDPAGVNEKRGVTSAALWDSLKTTCLHMQRVDLASLCDGRDLNGTLVDFDKQQLTDVTVCCSTGFRNQFQN